MHLALWRSNHKASSGSYSECSGNSLSNGAFRYLISHYLHRIKWTLKSHNFVLFRTEFSWLWRHHWRHFIYFWNFLHSLCRAKNNFLSDAVEFMSLSHYVLSQSGAPFWSLSGLKRAKNDKLKTRVALWRSNQNETSGGFSESSDNFLGIWCLQNFNISFPSTSKLSLKKLRFCTFSRWIYVIMTSSLTSS